MPGTFRMDRLAIKEASSVGSGLSTNCPSGLLKSEQILASMRLGATPQEQVTCSCVRTRRLISAAISAPVGQCQLWMLCSVATYMTHAVRTHTMPCILLGTYTFLQQGSSDHTTQVPYRSPCVGLWAEMST